MSESLAEKLSKLPTTPGIYFHKNARGEIIYIGKAANLRSRVRQYFQKRRPFDPKTDILINEIADIDWRELDTEADALFLEAEMVRRYRPRFNILLRDDKSLQFVRIDYKSDYPTVTLVRRPLDDGAEYFGPYVNSGAIKKALRYLRKAFPYATSHPVVQKRTSLHYHLGLDPGLEEGKTSLNEYRANLRKLMQYLRGERITLMNTIEKDMKKAAKNKEFEKATGLRNQLFTLQALNRQILFSDKELMDAANDEALAGLAKLLGLPQPPRRIEGYDISHIQGSDTVASMVVFINGVPDKPAYRKFKMRLPGNDDVGHLHETLTRRLREENRKKWGLGDLMLIDGGKGQLMAAVKARNQAGFNHIPTVGLAKHREEIIVSKKESLPAFNESAVKGEALKLGAFVSISDDFLSIALPHDLTIVKLLQRIRDESHRFAVSYHSTLRKNRQTASLLDDIPGIGAVTRKKLIKHFGSMRTLMSAPLSELETVLGSKRGAALAKHLEAYKQPIK